MPNCTLVNSMLQSFYLISNWPLDYKKATFSVYEKIRINLQINQLNCLNCTFQSTKNTKTTNISFF